VLSSSTGLLLLGLLDLILNAGLTLRLGRTGWDMLHGLEGEDCCLEPIRYCGGKIFFPPFPFGPLDVIDNVPGAPLPAHIVGRLPLAFGIDMDLRPSGGTKVCIVEDVPVEIVVTTFVEEDFERTGLEVRVGVSKSKVNIS